MDSPRAQIDSGARVTVTNLLFILRDVKWFTNEYPSPVKMYGATNRKLLITPSAVGHLRIPALTLNGYIDVKCYYSPHFSSTLLSESDLVAATGCPKVYSGQSTDKFFEWDHDAIDRDIANGIISLEKHYSVDSGKCMVTCHHKQV